MLGKLVISRVICFVIFNILLSTAMANEVSVQPRLTVSYKDFDYSVSGNSVRTDLASLGLGVTATYRRLYIDLNIERNLNSGTQRGEASTAYLERDDSTLTIGYALNESISIFSGYKYGRTRIVSPPSAVATGQQLSLEGRGLYVGAGGGIGLSAKDFLSFSAAYAAMEATYDEQGVLTTDGDASGTSLSVTWKRRATESLDYSAGLVRHDYYYEDFQASFPDISEQILSLRVSVAYRF